MITSERSLNEERSTALDVFEQERRRLFGIAYRMLGSVSEAEDVLQDAYVRWHAVAHEEISNPAAFLVRLVTRLCIDTLKSARNKRTEYIGPWLPEPFLAGHTTDDNPVAVQELADDLSMAFLLLLERLTPVERAVFLLHESFDFSYGEIAQVLGKSEQNCRQIARRARQHLEADGQITPADPHEHDRLLNSFLRAAHEGDMQSMLQLLAPNAVLYSDGGGKAQAARRPVSGADNIVRFLLGLGRKFGARMEVRPSMINGRTGWLTYIDGTLHNAMTMLIADGKIHQIFVVVNPDKLPHA